MSHEVGQLERALAARCWCDERTATREMDVELAEVFAEQLAELTYGLELAWGLIANAHGGDWDNASAEWRTMAERWRDGVWHPLLALKAMAGEGNAEGSGEVGD